MKFRFCGDGDCPDWVLTEITTLTLLTSIKMKLLCGLVAKSMAGEDFDFERAKTLTGDAKLGEADVRGAVAGLRWLLGSASRSDVDPDSFSSELQQLGLPREHALAASKVFRDHTAAIRAHLRRTKAHEASCSAVASSSRTSDGAEPAVDPLFSLNLTVRDCIAERTNGHQITMTRLQLQELLEGERLRLAVVTTLAAILLARALRVAGVGYRHEDSAAWLRVGG
ncbi:hypothetical protein ONE63_008996 [Megalurothrips usitatus]|uniref:COMM domain-containing protein 4 n=1 Tax=Megalurothrips usitatus TaxID=439358 RepID=A0AAV7XI77_9NEOP|nr:hypothetical protein ONE63_008996 [Megalurothrips usitatus]